MLSHTILLSGFPTGKEGKTGVRGRSFFQAPATQATEQQKS